MSNIYESDKAENSANLKAGMSTPGLDNANEARRASLRERVENQKNHSCREARRVERLVELAYLLDKHPDVARILELIDEVRL
jgi:hypothetical protein